MADVLYIVQRGNVEPWLTDFREVAAGRFEMALLDHEADIAPQFDGVEVVVDQGGHATREMIDAGAAAGVRLWQVDRHRPRPQRGRLHPRRAASGSPTRPASSAPSPWPSTRSCSSWRWPSAYPEAAANCRAASCTCPSATSSRARCSASSGSAPAAASSRARARALGMRIRPSTSLRCPGAARRARRRAVRDDRRPRRPPADVRLRLPARPARRRARATSSTSGACA